MCLEHKPAQHDQAAASGTPSLFVNVLSNLCCCFNLKEDPQRVITQCLHSTTANSDNKSVFLIGPRCGRLLSILVKSTHSNTTLLRSQSAHIEECACGYSALSDKHASAHRRETHIALTVAANMSVSTMISMRMVVIRNDAGVLVASTLVLLLISALMSIRW